MDSSMPCVRAASGPRDLPMPSTLADADFSNGCTQPAGPAQREYTAGGCPSYGLLSLNEVPLIVAGEIRPGWRLVAPISITVRADGDGWFVADTDSYAVHGTGQRPSDAVADLLVCLIEYYELIETSARTGNAFDQGELRRLRMTLQPTPI